MTCDGKSATLNVTKGPLKDAEVWKIKLFVATGFHPAADKAYHLSVDVDSPAKQGFELCYNEGDTEKGFGAEYSQRLTGKAQTLDYIIRIPKDKKNPGELILQFSLGKLKTGDQVTISNVRLEEASPSYRSVLPKDFSFTKENTSVDVAGMVTKTTVRADAHPTVNWDAKASVTKSGDKAGDLVVLGGSASLKVNGGKDLWDARLNIDTGERLWKDKAYRVSFDIWSDKPLTEYEVLYGTALNGVDNNQAYGPLKGLSLTAGRPETIEYMIRPEAAGGLLISLQVGKADGKDNTVTVSGLKVEEVAGRPGSPLPVSVTYPIEGGLTKTDGSFEVRNDSGHGGDITGDGSSATMTCTGGVGAAWQRGMFTGDVCEVSAGNSYQVSFDIQTNGQEFNFEVCHNRNKDWEEGQGAFGYKYGLTAPTTETTIEYFITPTTDGKLRLRIDLGRAADNTVVKVSDIHVYKAKGTPTGSNLASVNYPNETASINPGTFEVRDGNGGTITGGGANYAEMTCTGGDKGEGKAWERGLYIKDLCTLSAGTSYQVSFDITADKETPFEVRYNKEHGWDDSNGFGLLNGLTASSTVQTVNYTVTPAADCKLNPRVDLGRAAEGAVVKVSDIHVRPVEYAAVSESNIDRFCSVSAEGIEGYMADLTKKPDSAVLKVTKPETDATGWKAKLFIRTGVPYIPGRSYRALFNITAKNAVKEFCVISQGVPDSEDIRGTWALTLDAGETKTITTRPVPAGKGTGELVLQIELGNFEGTENTFTVSDVRVEEVDLDTVCDYRTDLEFRGSSSSLLVRKAPPAGMLQFWKVKLFVNTGVHVEEGETYRVTYSYARKSALPAEVEYKTPSAVSYWAHEDYKTTFTGSEKAITANILSAPASGAEPWKVKLFLDTGKPLQGGKYYRVTANVSSKLPQDYEICYNNGGVEMGYDSLGGLRLTGGKTQTVERVIPVPAGMTGANNLTLQFNLGKTTAANSVTVSGVKVEEVPFSYIDVMEKGFAYTPGRTVSVWTNPDYTAKLESAGSGAALHITGVPSTGAEVWKVKLLVKTGASFRRARPISSGRTCWRQRPRAMRSASTTRRRKRALTPSTIRP